MGVRPSFEQPFKIFAFTPQCASLSLINKIKISIFIIWTVILIADVVLTNYLAGLFIAYYLPFRNTSFPVIAACPLSYISLLLTTILCLRCCQSYERLITDLKSFLIAMGIILFLTICHGISIAIIPAIILEICVPIMRKQMLGYQYGYESMGYMRDVNNFLQFHVLSQIKKPKHATKLALYNPKFIQTLLYTFIHINVLTGENMNAYCNTLIEIINYYIDNIKHKNDVKLFKRNINALFKLEYNETHFTFWTSKTAFNHYGFMIGIFSFFVFTIYIFHIIIFWSTFGQTYLKYYDYNIWLFWIWVIRDSGTIFMCIFLIYLYRGEIVFQVKENYSWLHSSLFESKIKTMYASTDQPESIFFHQHESTMAYQLMYYLFWSEIIKDTLNEVIMYEWMIAIIMKYCCGSLQFNNELKKNLQQQRTMNKHPFIPIYVNENNYDDKQWIESQWIYKQMFYPHRDDDEYKKRHVKLIYAWKLVQLLNKTYVDTTQFENDETVPLLKQ